jgi:outer membrane protein OmpA-like peptidoglycan-associated protein
MNKMVRALINLAVFFLICPASGQADIVYIKNGDKLIGKIKNPSFTLKSAYGKIQIEREFLKSLSFENRSLLDDRIQFIQEDGKHKTISTEKIKRVWLETQGPSYPITTIIFTTKNNDRFSGKFLNSQLKIQTKTLTKPIKPKDINRIEFIDEFQMDTKILLENGDLISGTLQNDPIRVAPDTVTELSIPKSQLKAIQFNAPKMVLKQFGNAARLSKDGDGDGIPDYADLCLHTPKGSAVNQDGCPQKSIMANIIVEKKEGTRTKNENKQPTGPIGDIEKILFDFDKYELKPQYFSALDHVAERLARDPHLNIEIKGHTDNIGTEAYNQILSQNRAQMVSQYLKRKGIEPRRLFPKGFGFRMNTASNETEAGRALNRRVEITPITDQKTLVFYRH